MVNVTFSQSVSRVSSFSSGDEALCHALRAADRNYYMWQDRASDRQVRMIAWLSDSLDAEESAQKAA